MKNINALIILIALFILAGCSAKNVVINSRETWNANDPLPYQSHIPERITIHHEGEFLSEEQNAAKHIRDVQVWGMGPDRKWTDIPYHFLIDLKGNIYEGRNVFTTGETATTYDPTGHLLICCMGNFEEQDLPEAQLNALINLTAYCCKKYQVSPETIAAHQDYAETLCPGKNLYIYIENGYIKKRVKDILANGTF